MFVPTLISRNTSTNKFRYNQTTKESPLGRYPKRILVNIGSRSEYCKTKVKEILKQGGYVINHPDYINNASNKVIAKEAFNRLKIPTPNYALAENSDEVVDLTFPVVAKLIKGTGGEGMVLINDTKELDKFYQDYSEQLSNYFIEEVFQPKLSRNYEFRVISFPDNIGTLIPLVVNSGVSETASFITKYPYYVPTTAYIVRKKIKKDAVESGGFGRNISSGNAFFCSDITLLNSNEEKNEKLVCTLGELAASAVKALSLDFGAVDILYDSETDSYTVLEVNTAFSLEGENSSENFLKIIKEYMNSFFDSIVVTDEPKI